jgi:hypothetical protein
MAVHEMKARLGIPLGIFAIVIVSACGRAGVTQQRRSTGSAATVSSACMVQTTTGLLTAAQVGPQMATHNPPPSTSTSLGLFGDGDSAYPGYVGRASGSFYWTGLASPQAETLTGQAWSGLNYSGTPPPGDFLPSGGDLYLAYPAQEFLVAEEVDDFGSATNTEQWMSYQRQDNPPNRDPKSGNGVESDPTIAPIGDDDFVYQLDRGAPTTSDDYSGNLVGDVYTDLEVRTGDLIFSVSLDASPGVDGVQAVVSLSQQLIAKENSSCSN